MNIELYLQLLRSVYKMETDHAKLIQAMGIYANKHKTLSMNYYYLSFYFLSKYNLINDFSGLRTFNKKSFLHIEPLSKQSWFINSSNHFNANIWYKYEDMVKDLAKGSCACCGLHYSVSDLHLKEIWEFDDIKKIQTLIVVVPTCIQCLNIKVSQNQSPEEQESIKAYLMKANNWKYTQADEHYKKALKMKLERDQSEWIVNIDFLLNEIKLSTNSFKDNEFDAELIETIKLNADYLKSNASSEFNLNLSVKCRVNWI